MASDEIHTERLRLRRAKPSDLGAVHALMSDPETMRYWSTPPHADLDTTRRWLEVMIAAPSDLSDDFLVECDGEVIGNLGASRLPEVGYLLSRAHWGRGYASEGMAAYIARSFGRGLDHLTADVDPRNEASIRLLTRHGFRESGRAARTFCVAGEWCDSLYFRLDRPDE